MAKGFVHGAVLLGIAEITRCHQWHHIVVLQRRHAYRSAGIAEVRPACLLIRSGV